MVAVKVRANDEHAAILADGDQDEPTDGVAFGHAPRSEVRLALARDW